MKKFLCVFLILVICSSFFILSAHAEAAPATGTAYVYSDSSPLYDLSFLSQNGSQGGMDSSGGFNITFPSVMSESFDGNESFLIVSGNLCFYEASTSYSFNFSNVYPTLLNHVRSSNGTFLDSVDISSYYNTRTGRLNYSDGNTSFSSQSHYSENGNFLISFVFLSSSTAARDATISFNSPYFSNIVLSCSNFYSTAFYADSTAVQDSVNSLRLVTSNGLNGVQTAVNALSSLTQSNFESTEQLLNSLDAAISNLQDSVTDSVYNALDDWHQHELDFVETDMNPIVQGVVDDINDLYDYDTFYNAFNSVVNMVTGGNTRAAPTTRLRIPAGVVTVGGQTYRFWEETYVDFAPVFENSMIQLLLVPFRFLIAYAFLRYCMYWINKLINTITLHIKAGDY